MTKPNDVNEAPVHGIVHMPKCWTCEGTGEILYGILPFVKSKCWRCNGTGVFDMRQKPTVGPWKSLCDEARGRPRCLVVDSQGDQIAEVNPHRESWNEDADLIAATPDLLEACKVAAEACRKNLAKYQYKDEVALLGAFKACQTAIEKALGKAWQ